MNPLSRPQQPPAPGRHDRYLALDYGSRRVGVALSDELGLFAHPRPAFVGLSGERLEASIAELVAAEGVREVIVGVPVSLSGGESSQTAEVRSFVQRLRSRLPVPVTEADERFTSTQAAEALRGREQKRSGQRDSAAAAIILQAVLDARRGGRPQ